MGRRLSSLRPALEVCDYLEKQSSVHAHWHVYLCLSHYISFCTYYCLHLYITVIIQLHFKVFCTHFLQTGKPYKQTQEIGRYFTQSVYSSDPQRFSNNTKKSVSILSLATNKNPINWEEKKTTTVKIKHFEYWEWTALFYPAKFSYCVLNCAKTLEGV